jgi:hypothetical protein
LALSHWRRISADSLRLTCAPLVLQLTGWYAHARRQKLSRPSVATSGCVHAVSTCITQVPAMRCLTGLLPHWSVWVDAEHLAWQGGPGWLCPELHRELEQAVLRPVTPPRPRSHCCIRAFRGVCQWSRVVRCGWSGWVGRRQPSCFDLRADCTQNLPPAARGRGEDPQPCARVGVVPGA